MKKLEAKLFGNISFKVDGEELVEGNKKVKKHIELLALMLTYYDRELSNDNIAEMLWDEDSIEEPAGALKNCVYNLRKMLAKVAPGQDFVVTKSKQYRWNKEVEMKCDLWDFLELADESKTITDEGELKECLRKAIALCDNDFLYPLSGQMWVVQEANYLRQKYIAMNDQLCKILLKENTTEALEEVIKLCNKATTVDPLSEEIYVFIFEAMYRLGMNKAIFDYYPSVTKLFMDELGVEVPADIVDIYELACNSDYRNSGEIQSIIDDLVETTNEMKPLNGAFFCKYDTFKHMFHMMVRSTLRNDCSVIIVLLTLLCPSGQPVNHEEMKTMMEHMKNATMGTVRKGDIVSRYSGNQLVVMLAVKNEKDSEVVKKRLSDAFENHKPKLNVDLEVIAANAPAIF